MQPLTCRNADCTVATTGRCLESHTPPETCPFFGPSTAGEACPGGDPSPSLTPPQPAAASEPARRFHSGLELGLSDALAVTRARYAHLVGVLGAANAGKTCFLNSLYLLSCHGQLLPEFRFAGSLTLQGFELRSRRLRNWKQGVLPDQLADHTLLKNPRQPAFVHLALDRIGRGRVELLLTDLPGEWSTGLINRAATASRFDFLARADAVCIAVDGPRLAARETRHNEATHACHLVERLAGNVGLDRAIPLIVLVTKGDEIEMKLPADVARIEERAKSLGYQASVIATAAVSRDPAKVANGEGVAEVVKAILDSAASGAGRPPELPRGSRSFLRIGT